MPSHEAVIVHADGPVMAAVHVGGHRHDPRPAGGRHQAERAEREPALAHDRALDGGRGASRAMHGADYRTTPCVDQWMRARCACVDAKSSGMAPPTLVAAGGELRLGELEAGRQRHPHALGGAGLAVAGSARPCSPPAREFAARRCAPRRRSGGRWRQ